MTERVLCVAAHPDDEVLGCGGTLARHAAEGDEVHILFLADGETSRGIKALPNRNFMAHAAAQALGAQVPIYLDYADQRLDQVALLDVTQAIENTTTLIRPTIVYTHHAGDLNRDHQIAHQAAMTAFRPLPDSPVKAIYAFEVISSTEWGSGFEPDHFVNIGNTMGQKMDALKCYASEMREAPHARSEISIANLAKMRGNSVGRYFAEAFMTMRSIR